ncbi:MAG: hypothetical protein Q8Q29_09930 [Actinomycetota bacterium]|nr:hypothetical protein [Actinomycetota bacterium]
MPSPAETSPSSLVWGLVIVGVLVVAGAIVFLWRGKGLAPLNPLAGISLLAGIGASLVGLLLSYLVGGLLGLAAVYLGISGRQDRVHGGLALAITGMVLGGVAVAMYLVGRLIN